MWFYLPTVSPLWHPLIPLCNLPVFLFPLFICLLFQVSPAFPIVCHTPLFLLLPLPYFVSVILFSQVEERILVGICVPPGGGTHITRDMCFPGGEHISQGICVSQGGECISVGIQQQQKQVYSVLPFCTGVTDWNNNNKQLSLRKYRYDGIVELTMFLSSFKCLKDKISS